MTYSTMIRSDYDTTSRLVFVRFLEKIEDTKKSFRSMDLSSLDRPLIK